MACRPMRVDEASLDCECPAMPEGSAGEAVWGSGPYTYDSDVCMAARHAGVVRVEGGPISAVAVAGLGAYAASTANGVATQGWGAYGRSLDFAQ